MSDNWIFKSTCNINLLMSSSVTTELTSDATSDPKSEGRDDSGVVSLDTLRRLRSPIMKDPDDKGPSPDSLVVASFKSVFLRDDLVGVVTLGVRVGVVLVGVLVLPPDLVTLTLTSASCSSVLGGVTCPLKLSASLFSGEPDLESVECDPSRLRNFRLGVLEATETMSLSSSWPSIVDLLSVRARARVTRTDVSSVPPSFCTVSGVSPDSGSTDLVLTEVSIGWSALSGNDRAGLEALARVTRGGVVSLGAGFGRVGVVSLGAGFGRVGVDGVFFDLVGVERVVASTSGVLRVTSSSTVALDRVRRVGVVGVVPAVAFPTADAVDFRDGDLALGALETGVSSEQREVWIPCSTCPFGGDWWGQKEKET